MKPKNLITYASLITLIQILIVEALECYFCYGLEEECNKKHRKGDCQNINLCDLRETFYFQQNYIPELKEISLETYLNEQMEDKERLKIMLQLLRDGYNGTILSFLGCDEGSPNVCLTQIPMDGYTPFLIKTCDKAEACQTKEKISFCFECDSDLCNRGVQIYFSKMFILKIFLLLSIL